MKIFGERLRDLRNQQGISAMTLGKIVGVSDVAILNWENNKNDIKAEYLVLIAKFFEVSADYLIGLTDFT